MAEHDADIRRIRKKLGQISALEARFTEGDSEPSPEEAAKIGLKDQFESDLLRLIELQAEVAKPPPLDDLAPTGRKSKRKSTAAGIARPPTTPTWQEDPAGVEDVAPTPKAAKEPEFELIEGVQPFAPTTKESERLMALCKATRELSIAAFDEDACEMCTKKGRWKLTLLAAPRSPDPSGDDAFGLSEGAEGESTLIGFVVWRLNPDQQALAIAKLAVMPEHRRRGHGCRMIDWCLRYAKKQGNILYVSLSSLPEAVCFYKAIGFKQVDVRIDESKAGCGENEELVEGQVYMEYFIKGGRRKSKK